MVRRSYLSTITLVSYALTNIASPVSAAEFGTTCDRTTYGLPNYQACRALLLGGAGVTSRDGIFHIDSFEHGFLLPYFGHRSQFTDWQWRHRVTLPQVWRNRKFAVFRIACGKDGLRWV